MAWQKRENTVRIDLLRWRRSLGLVLLFFLLMSSFTLSVESAPLSALQTDVCGAITTTTTWTAASSPYVVTCDVTVNANVVLTLEPGTTVRFREPNFSSSVRLVVNGTLRAQGTAEAPIVLTSNRGSPVKGDWKGITFAANSTNSLLDHVVVEYAGAFDSSQGPTSGVTLNTSSVTVTNSAIRHNQYTGLDVASGSPTVTNNEFSDNRSALSMNVNSAPVMSGNTATGNTYNGVTVGGEVTSGVTWPSTNLPYLPISDITVNSGQTLTLQAGTRLQFVEPNFSSSVRLVVNGTLRAQGTAEAPIVLTSNRGSPVKGDWKGITFAANSTNSLLDHVVVEYAGAFDSSQGPTSGVTLNTSSVTVTNSAIRHNQYTGLDVASGSPTLISNDITDNAIGIQVRTGTPTIRRNDLHGNRDYGLKNEGSTCLDAQDNWWGSDFGPNDPSSASDACGQGARPGPGDKVSDNVIYTPWRTHGVLQMLYLPMVARCWTLEPPQPPRTPDINDIDNGDGDGRYTVTWTATGGCSGAEYTLEEDENPSFASPTTVYTGPQVSKEISGKDVGTYYYRVRARNPQGTSEWSARKSVVVTIPPPPCGITCFANSGGAGFGISCEAGQATQTSSCYQAWDDTRGWVTHCSGTRTYANTGNTYSFVLETWLFASNGVVKNAVSVDVRGGIFGDNVQHCQNY